MALWISSQILHGKYLKCETLWPNMIVILEFVSVFIEFNGTPMIYLFNQFPVCSIQFAPEGDPATIQKSGPSDI